jgi:hypothetical protein
VEEFQRSDVGWDPGRLPRGRPQFTFQPDIGAKSLSGLGRIAAARRERVADVNGVTPAGRGGSSGP